MKRRVYLPMVDWYSPLQLFKTFLEVVQSSLVTRIIDPRALATTEGPKRAKLVWRTRIASLGWTNLDAFLSAKKEKEAVVESEGEGEAFDRRDEDELWLDFVADTGDGWNPTFSVARTVAEKTLDLVDPAQRHHTLPRADVLLFGGDLVYPTPRDDAYDIRLVAPYEQALPKAENDPDVFAIPGNHDWYDGLYQFRERFCRPGRSFAAWRTQQTRSYFAIALPGDWWLLGADAQLGRRLDEAQIDYFSQVKRNFNDDTRIILMIPNPDWLELPEARSPHAPLPSQQIEEVLGHPADVCLTGSLHHYRRHETIPDDAEGKPCQRITAGGGGAFLHATHDLMHRTLRARLVNRASFPPPEASKRYQKRLLAFPLDNPTFGIVPAAYYGLLAMAGLPVSDFESYTEFLPLFLRSLWDPSGMAVVALVFVSTLLFRQRKSVASFLLASGHGALQVLGASIATYLAYSLVGPLDALVGSVDLSGWTRPLAIGGAIAGGWVIGSVMMGLYLWISATCRLGLDHAFSALKIQDWKSFLRIRVRKDGSLTIYPIGLRRVARNWRVRTNTSGESRLEPEDKMSRPELIEVPIEL